MHKELCISVGKLTSLLVFFRLLPPPHTKVSPPPPNSFIITSSELYAHHGLRGEISLARGHPILYIYPPCTGKGISTH